MSDTIVWVSGATSGIGLGIARNCPYKNARIINLSRRTHPDLESVKLDLTDPKTIDDVRRHFEEELANFRGERALFIQNAVVPIIYGFVGEISAADHQDQLAGIGVAPLVLGEAFVRAAATTPQSCDTGLVMLTSTAARNAYEGGAPYNSAKASIEHWVRTVRRERALRDGRPWLCAIEPGFVDTPGSRDCAATVDPRDYPSVTHVREAFEAGQGFDDIDTVARATWAALPRGGPQDPVLHFSGGAMHAAI